MNYVLINKMVTKPGMRQEVADIMLEAGQPFNENPACLMYLISNSKIDENVLWIQDIWIDKDSHEEAMKSDTMREYIKKAMPLLESMPEQFEVDIVGGKSNFIS